MRSLILFFAVLALACGDDTSPEFDGGPEDVGADVEPDTPPDAGPTCMDDEDCDDGVSCTRDLCEDGFCRNRDDSAMCDDGVFCNGLEFCDRILGRCAPGDLRSCNDEDVCTIDRCDEEAKVCRYSPRDFDGDGEADWNCEGGTDCDDRDPTRSTSVNEICSDDIDNDCDEVVDEEECGRPPHDTCDDPLDVSAGGVFEVSTEGALPDYDLACGPDGRPDAVLTFELEESKDVTIRADGRSLTYVALRTTCDSRDDEFECAGGFPGQVRARSLAPGRYYALIADLEGEVGVEVIFGDATPLPTNESCDAPLDVSEGGRFSASFVDVMDDVSVSCGSRSAPDLVYTFTTEEEQDVVYSASTEGGDSLTVALQSTCGGDDDLRCNRGRNAGGRMHRLAPGTYFLVVEGSASREVDFSLDVAFEAPTDPPEGDRCDNPLPAVVNGTTPGTLIDKQDDHSTSCGFFYREAVHTFTLEEDSDVRIEADGGGFNYLSLRSTCDDEESELRCRSGSPSRVLVRNLRAGTYFVMVEASSATDYELMVTATPPTFATAVTGNIDCDSAYTMPPTGGLFTGNTSAALPDYSTRTCGASANSPDAAFVLTLDRAQRVVATTDGSSFDTVLHVHRDMCVSDGELYCDDDGGEGSASLLTRILDPGTYYFIVDGWGGSASGDYFFEVLVSDP